MPETPSSENARAEEPAGRRWLGSFGRAIAATRRDNVPMIASALAYSSFFAIPSVALLVIGAFTLAASPSDIASLMHRFGAVMPTEATDLLGSSLRHLQRRQSAGAAIVGAGAVLALWSTTGAMSAYMTGLNVAYGCTDKRGFVRRRLVALAMVACVAAAASMTAVLLVFGPVIERHLGDSLGIQGYLAYVWWIAQWPILIVGLLVAFETMYWLGPDIGDKRWRVLSPGSVVAVAAWLAVSGGLAAYTAEFGSYDKTWGTLAAVIVTLTWLWLTGIALLFGAELNAEREGRSPAARAGTS